MAANRVIGAVPAVAAHGAVSTFSGVPNSFESDPHGCDGQPIGFDFSASSLTAVQQAQFRADLRRELVRLQQWLGSQNWPVADHSLTVVVSDQFRISKSLVPAWSGHAGLMQFPTWRVEAGKAAIVHELVHVFMPNGNRLLAEGLAVHLQALIGGNPAFPNFGRPLHDLLRDLLPRMVSAFGPGDPASLKEIRLAELDAIGTPSPLVLTVGDNIYGEEPRGQAHVYPLAGSFVQHLIEMRGLETFRKLYALSPLVPQHQDAGPPGRWAETYGCPLSWLEAEWKTMLVGG